MSQLETGLPAWTYVDDDFFALERAKIFAPSWQIICHESDIADKGAYATLNFMGRLIMLVRGDDGAVRAFRNVCRHRAARLLDNNFGACSSRIVCPYHAWTYDLKGRFVGAPHRASYEEFRNEDYGLFPLKVEECGGFYFVLTGEDGPSFDDFIAPMREEFEIYKTKQMRALGRISLRERAVNWKIATENYVDKLHLPVAHEGLSGLVGPTYELKIEGEACRIEADLEAAAGPSLSAETYRKYLPEETRVPDHRRQRWIYMKLWPNLAFDLYPDQIDFMQFIPLAPGRTLLREISYALPDERREMRAARYLNWRVNRVVNVEDKDIIERTQAGFASGDYEPGPIAKDEIGLRDFVSRMRHELPVCLERQPPRAAMRAEEI